MIDLDAVQSLTNSERDAIRKHCQLSGSILRILAIQSFLVEQVHEKRSVFKKGKFKPNNPEIDKLYSSILFGGRRRVTSFSTFPSSFRCYLDDLLLRDVKESQENKANIGFRMIDVYYTTTRVTLQEMQKAKAFVTAEWELMEPADDRAVIIRYRDEFIELMQRLADFVKDGKHSAKANRELKTEIKRYCKAAGSV
jgi:hypothetical protein